MAAGSGGRLPVVDIVAVNPAGTLFVSGHIEDWEALRDVTGGVDDERADHPETPRPAPCGLAVNAAAGGSALQFPVFSRKRTVTVMMIGVGTPLSSVGV